MSSRRIKPVLHFITENRSVETEQGKQEYTVVELVHRGAEIVSLGSPAEDAAALVSGENTTLSEDGASVFAAVSGYPLVMRGEKVDEGITISIVPFVSVASDRMSVIMQLHPPVSGRSSLILESILEILAEEGVVSGRDNEAIRQALATVEGSGRPLEGIMVARGILPAHGTDAYLRFFVDATPSVGKISRDGSMDYRERQIFVGVEQGQLIATKVPATAGVPGRNVLGGELPARPGKDLKVACAGEVEYFPDLEEVRAKSAGVVSIVGGASIRVSARQVISGDIDYSTGNIDSRNAVEVKGTVQPGFRLRAHGDVFIGQNVHDAEVLCRSNIVVLGGVMGKKAKVEAGGNVELKFVEKGTVVAGEDITVRKECYYSSVMAGGALACGEAIVFGGELICGGDCRIRQIGGRNADAAVIAAGVDPVRYTSKKQLLEDLAELQQAMQDFLQRYGEGGTEQKKYLRMLKKEQNLQKKLSSLNLIPLTPEESLQDSLYSDCNRRISISGSVAAGTLLQIGNAALVLGRTLTQVCFFVDKGEIVSRQESYKGG